MLIYLSGKQATADDIAIIIDRKHYNWAIQWRWMGITSKTGIGRKIKWYGRRTIRLGSRTGRAMHLWLHKEICLRAHGMPPSPAHIIVDHLNGNSLDCREANLRWATPSENRRNYAGIFALQLRLDFKQNNGGLRVKRYSSRKGVQTRKDAVNRRGHSAHVRPEPTQPSPCGKDAPF